jgi:hypothetical protein
MILEKIPRIECVLIIPELIEGELDNLITEFIGNKKSLITVSSSGLNISNTGDISCNSLNKLKNIIMLTIFNLF